MSKEIKDWGFGVIETRETFYTQETIDKFKHKIADLQHRLEVAEKALELVVADKCKLENFIAESIVGKGCSSQKRAMIFRTSKERTKRR